MTSRRVQKVAQAIREVIAMAVLAPGWENDYEGRPSIQSMACLCKVATHHQTSEGTYNVLMVGLKRIEVVRALPPDKSFREAEVRILHDEYPEGTGIDRLDCQRKLLQLFKQVLPRLPEGSDQLESLLGQQIPLGMLTDIIAYTLDLPLEFKLLLLAQPNVDIRVQRLFDYLSTVGVDTTGREFPPPFSSN